MTVNLFDVDYYFDANPDLGDVGLISDEDLLNHFLNFGLNEGRRFSPLVDLNVYRNNNPDLGAAGLTTNSQLFDHLQNIGVLEGRIFSLVFDANFYARLYPDLQGAGLDNEELFAHFLSFGLNEGRVGSAAFDANFYLNNNADLRAAGFTRLQALEHYVSFGVREGRRGSQADSSSGDNLATAVDLGALGVASRTDFVGNSDPADIYRFVLNSPSNLSVSLRGLSADADVDLIQDFNGNSQIDFEDIIDGSFNGGSDVEAINRGGLAAGTYLVRVFQEAGDTNYTLNLSVSPV